MMKANAPWARIILTSAPAAVTIYPKMKLKSYRLPDRAHSFSALAAVAELSQTENGCQKPSMPWLLGHVRRIYIHTALD